MAQTTLFRGTQIQPGTITAAQFVSGLALPTSQLADGAKLVFTDGSRAMTAALNMGGFAATNGATPVNATDLVIKSYVDAIKNGVRLHWARVLSTANISSLSGQPTIDGYATAVGDVVWLMNQSTGSQNGPWTITSGSTAWTRPADWASGAVLPEGQYVIIDADGTTYKNTKWFVTNTGSITVDTTTPTFSQDLSGTVYTAGTGLILTGTVFKAALGNGTALDGSNNITVTPDPNRLLQTIAAGVGIKDGTAGQVLMANSNGNASYQTLAGDVTVTSAGATTVTAAVLRYAGIVTGEAVGGTVNGTNTAFTLANTPQNSSLTLFYNGQPLRVGSSYDYTISGTSITLNFAPLSGDYLSANYFK